MSTPPHLQAAADAAYIAFRQAAEQFAAVQNMTHAGGMVNAAAARLAEAEAASHRANEAVWASWRQPVVSSGGGGGGGGGGSAPAPQPPTPAPPVLQIPSYTPPPGIKQAEPDIVLNPEVSTTADFIVERFFEELGGTELINISRYDLIDGIDVVYEPIANLSRLRRRFNPNNIIALDGLSESSFSKYSIDLLARGMNEPYFDDNGDLVVEVDIIRPDENIDVEISESGTVNRIEL